MGATAYAPRRRPGCVRRRHGLLDSHHIKKKIAVAAASPARNPTSAATPPISPARTVPPPPITIPYTVGSGLIPNARSSSVKMRRVVDLQPVLPLVGVVIGALAATGGQVYVGARQAARARRTAARVLFAEIGWYRSSVRHALQEDDPRHLDPPDDLLAAWREHRSALAELSTETWMAVSNATNAGRLRALLIAGEIDESALRDADDWATEAMIALSEHIGDITDADWRTIREPPP